MSAYEFLLALCVGMGIGMLCVAGMLLERLLDCVDALVALFKNEKP